MPRKSLQILKFFTVYATLFFSRAFCEVYFQEEFSDGDQWQERWILSEHPSHEWGFFILSTGKFYGHPELSKGIQTFQNGMFYGISTKFPPFSNKGKNLVIQYTVKHEQKVSCSGGYLKLFNCSFNPAELNEKTPYLIMFGPDECSPNIFKVHVILNYKGKYYEIKKNILYKEDMFTHLYTLILKPDNTYEVLVDNVDVAKGKLKDDWDLLPPETFVNYTAEKPIDWDDNPTIYDPNDSKPHDWDQPEYIPDSTAAKPLDWDDDVDGEWEPPLVENPLYRGIWKPRQIPNPKYKGPWTHPRIKNPEYFDDPELYKFDEICGLGFDIWQVESGTVFDNILITDDIEYAEEHGWNRWGSLRDAEKRMAMNQLQSIKKKKKSLKRDEL